MQWSAGQCTGRQGSRDLIGNQEGQPLPGALPFLLNEMAGTTPAIIGLCAMDGKPRHDEGWSPETAARKGCAEVPALDIMMKLMTPGEPDE